MRNPPLTVTGMDAMHSCIPEKQPASLQTLPRLQNARLGAAQGSALAMAVLEPPLPLPALP